MYVCMYVCMYAYIYIYIYICISLSLSIYIYIYIGGLVPLRRGALPLVGCIPSEAAFSVGLRRDLPAGLAGEAACYARWDRDPIFSVFFPLGIDPISSFGLGFDPVRRKTPPFEIRAGPSWCFLLFLCLNVF